MAFWSGVQVGKWGSTLVKSAGDPRPVYGDLQDTISVASQSIIAALTMGADPIRSIVACVAVADCVFCTRLETVFNPRRSYGLAKWPTDSTMACAVERLVAMSVKSIGGYDVPCPHFIHTDFLQLRRLALLCLWRILGLNYQFVGSLSKTNTPSHTIHGTIVYFPT